MAVLTKIDINELLNRKPKLTKISKEEALNGLQVGGTPDPLLNLIGEKEANGNYNAYYSNASNEEINFTNMTISQVRAWQDDFVRQGSKSSAVGKYQIIRKTLDGLVKQMGLKGNERFDQSMQDRMATELLNGRGYEKWKGGRLRDEQFANNLAKEWASFPVVSGDKAGRSYYAGDGLNKALVDPSTVFSVLKEEKKYVG